MKAGSAAASPYVAQALSCLALFKGFRRNEVDFGASPTRILPLRVWRQLDDGQQADCRRVALARLIYSHFYSTVGEERSAGTPDKARRRHAQSKTLIAALSAANAGSGTVEGGWQTTRADGRLAISNGCCVLDLGDAAGAGGQADVVSPGDARLQLSVPKQFLSRSVGFYLAVGNRALVQGGTPLIRAYFNCTPEGSVCLMRLITCELNALDVPFHFKVLTEAPMIDRRDSAVLYFRAENLPQVRQLLEDAVPLLRTSTLTGVPPFTLPILPGVAMAEDPADGQSFGSSRSGMLADALVEHARLGSAEQGPQRFISLLEARFVQRGASLAAPYLHGAARDPFGTLSILPQRDGDRRLADDNAHQGIDDRLSQAPARIAEALCAGAIWHGDACTWLAPTLADGCWPTLPYEILGADLDDGASGVALFLASAWEHFGTQGFARCARGAARHALAALDATQAQSGTIVGWPETCLAVGMTGHVLGDPDLLARAVETARRMALDEVQDSAPHSPVEALRGRIEALSRLADLGHDGGLRSVIEADRQRLAVLASTTAAIDIGLARKGGGLRHGWYGNPRAPLGAERVRVAHALLARLQNGPGDLALCHGLVGEAGMLDASRPESAAPDDEICDRAVQAVTRTVLDLLMPAGVFSPLGRFAHPSLMQGLSGIGLFLLQRLRGAPGPLSVLLGAPAGYERQLAPPSAIPAAPPSRRDATARLA